MKNGYSNKIFEVEYNDQEKILRLVFKRGSTINLEAAKEVMDSIRASKNETLANIVNTKEMLFMSKEARSYFAANNKETVLCIAVIINSKFQKSLGNMYLRFNKPKINTRLFEGENEAVSWVKEVLKERL